MSKDEFMRYVSKLDGEQAEPMPEKTLRLVERVLELARCVPMSPQELVDLVFMVQDRLGDDTAVEEREVLRSPLKGA